MLKQLLGFSIFLLLPLSAIAQEQGGPYHSGNWYSLSYIYDDFRYEEPGAMKETGPLPGLHGDFGINMMPWLTLGGGFQYVSGNLTYDGATFGGTPVTTLTKDRNWHINMRVYFFADPIEFSIGWARRYLYNNLVVSYRREETYNFIPIALTYKFQPFYATYEYRNFVSGENLTHMSDVSSAQRDVKFKQDTGSGFSLEFGYIIPAQPVSTKVFLRYDYWHVAQSDIQNDNTQNLVEPDNNTREIFLGIGVIY